MNKEQRNTYMREWQRKRKAAMSPEDRAAFNAKRRAEVARRLATSPASVEKERAKSRRFQARQRAKMTSEEKRARSLIEIGRKRKWREAHPEERKAESRQVYAKNPDHYKAIQSEYRAKTKLEVFARYGTTCQCCGEDESVFLSIDHINGDGACHRHLHKSGASFYQWLKKAGYPDGFQVLCMNCNVAKRTKGECPHRKIVMDKLRFSLLKGGGSQ